MSKISSFTSSTEAMSGPAQRIHRSLPTWFFVGISNGFWDAVGLLTAKAWRLLGRSSWWQIHLSLGTEKNCHWFRMEWIENLVIATSCYMPSNHETVFVDWKTNCRPHTCLKKINLYPTWLPRWRLFRGKNSYHFWKVLWSGALNTECATFPMIREFWKHFIVNMCIQNPSV